MVLLLPLLLILLLLLLLLLLLPFFFRYVEPIQPEGTPFGMFLTLGCCELKESVSTQTYLHNPSIQHSLECLVINWMVNSHYGPYQL